MTTPVDDPTEVDRESGRLFEVSVRKWADPNSIEDKIFAWGVDATNKKILSNLTVRLPPLLRHHGGRRKPEAGHVTDAETAK